MQTDGCHKRGRKVLWVLQEGEITLSCEWMFKKEVTLDMGPKGQIGHPYVEIGTGKSRLKEPHKQGLSGQEFTLYA